MPKSFWGIFSWLLWQKLVQAIFSKVAKGCVANVVAYGNGRGQLFIQSQVLGNGRSHRCHVKDVFHAGADVIVFWGKEHLGFVLQSTKGFTVKEASVISLKFGANVVVSGIQFMLPLNGLLPVGIIFFTSYLNKCIFHSSTILSSITLYKFFSKVLAWNLFWRALSLTVKV